MSIVSCQGQNNPPKQGTLSEHNISDIIAPAFFTHTTSKLKVTALFDGILYMNRNEVRGLLNDKIEALITANPDRETNKGIITSINAFLIEQNGELAIVDFGAGNNYDSFNPGLGNIEKSLRLSGIAPEEIKHIFLTHNHDDHTGGLVNKNGSAIYPNATLWVNKTEAPSGISNADTRPYTKKGRVKYFEIGDKLPLGAQSIATYGHTRGHTAFLFGSEVLVWGDVVHFPDIQFQAIQAGTVYDSNVQQAAATRYHIMQQAVKNKWIVAGAHLDYPGLGWVMEGDTAQKFQWKALD
ncbi:MAG: Hydroxyacylglutathione hydrolase [Ignavibacteriaceae bacterium]|nr:Hydroxyacylglutathione hydrolase [Ignavibacteriaceae bacterium]